MCRDIANQCTWAGSRWSEEDWKRIFLGAKFGQPIVPSPFGHGVVVVNAKRSRDLSREDMAELIGKSKCSASKTKSPGASMSRSEAPHVKESGHWYDRDGTPRYEVLDAKGKMRPATLGMRASSAGIRA
jgi:hypothetical protein